MGNGLTVAADTWYHFFLIKDDTNTIYDAGIDTELTATNLLTKAGSTYTRYRRLASFKTATGTTDILSYTQTDSHFQWASPVDDVAAVTNQNDTSVTRTLTTPPDVKVMAQVNIYVESFIQHSQAIYVSSLDADDEPAGSYLTPVAPYGNAMAGAEGGINSPGMGTFLVRTNTSQQIRTVADDARDPMDVFGLATLGWIDSGLRGPVISDTN
jgi:hypothetical protein